MLVVIVQTKAFSAEFLHKSELPEEALAAARKGNGIFSEALATLEMALLDSALAEKFQDLPLSQAVKVWNAYRMAVPIEKGMPDVLPAQL